MKNVVYLLALALIVGMCFSGNVYATGAIAISDEDELYGFCSGKDGKDEAKACALKACKNGGGSNCKFRVWFEGCGAVAWSAKYFGVGWGEDLETAESKALDECGHNCKIVVSKCDE